MLPGIRPWPSRLWTGLAACLGLGVLFLAAPAWGWRPVMPPCRACHQGIEAMEGTHDLPCLACHQPLAGEASSIVGHPAVAAHPADLDHARASCGACHPDRVEALLGSDHALQTGMRAQTRYLWGAAAMAGSGGSSARALPVDSPAGLVDRFLDECCSGCHLGRPGVGLDQYRGAGCAACHVPYAPDGLYAGGDPALTGRGPGSPRFHALTGPVGQDRCLACHHSDSTGERVGADFIGLTPRDSHAMFQGALTRGEPVLRAFGTAQHALSPDVHYQRNMACPDCHSGEQVMGMPGGRPPACRDCHRDLAQDVPGHRPELHGRVHCSACHAQWLSTGYDFSVSLVDGQWLLAWAFRRWDVVTLGVDGQGGIRLLRPRNQYLVSMVDATGAVVLDNQVPQRGDGSGPGWAFEPCVPHTNAEAGRPCHECHGQPLAAGLGSQWTPAWDLALLRPWPPATPGARLLNAAEQGRLLDPGRGYAAMQAASLARFLEPWALDDKGGSHAPPHLP